MINIFLIDSDSRPSKYGIGTYISTIANALAEFHNRLKVHVIILYSDKLEFEIFLSKTNITYLEIPKVLTISGSKINDYKYFMRVIDLLILNNIYNSINQNIFHFNYFNHFEFAKLCKKRLKGKIIYTLHIFSWAFQLNGTSKKLECLLKKGPDILSKQEAFIINNYRLEREMFMHSDMIFILNEDSFHITRTIYNISYTKLFLTKNFLQDNYIAKANLPYSNFGLNNNEFHIIYVGRLDEGKGINELINSFKIVSQKHKNIRLLLIGDGNVFKYIDNPNIVHSKVSFMGKLARKSLLKLYKIADIAIIPSYYEQCSFVAIEMMMFGLPIIATDCIGLKEMFNNNVNSLVIPCKISKNSKEYFINVQSLAKKIEFLIENKSYAAKIGTNARKSYLTNYNKNTNIDYLVSLYTQGLAPQKV